MGSKARGMNAPQPTPIASLSSITLYTLMQSSITLRPVCRGSCMKLLFTPTHSRSHPSTSTQNARPSTSFQTSNSPHNPGVTFHLPTATSKQPYNW